MGEEHVDGMVDTINELNAETMQQSLRIADLEAEVSWLRRDLAKERERAEIAEEGLRIACFRMDCGAICIPTNRDKAGQCQYPVIGSDECTKTKVAYYTEQAKQARGMVES